MMVADLPGPLAASPIAAAVEVAALAGAGVLTGVATAIAAATGCTVLAAAFAAAAAAAASVVAVALSLPSLPPVDDVFAGAADASDWVCVESAGGGAPFGAAGFACEAELFGPPAAFVLVVALLADWALVLPPVAALEDVPPAFAGGELLVLPCGGADVVPVLCAAAEFELASAVAGRAEVLLCRGVPPAGIGAGLAVSGGLAGAVIDADVAVVASSNAANGCESATGAGVGAGDHGGCAIDDDAELTSDAVLDTA
jgi:hypothetical protein